MPPPALFVSGRIFGGFGWGGYIPGQTFTPRFHGLLKEVRLGLQNAGDPGDPTPVLAEVRAVQGAFPTSVVLAQAPVSGAPYVAGNLYKAAFTVRPPVLEAGTRHAITLRAGGPSVACYILAAFPRCDPSSGSNDPVHSLRRRPQLGLCVVPGRAELRLRGVPGRRDSGRPRYVGGG